MGDRTGNISDWELACKCGCGLNNVHPGIIHRVQAFCDIAKKIVCQSRGIGNFKIILDITNATRCLPHHQDIYKKINKRRKKAGLPIIIVPMLSGHLVLKDRLCIAIDGKIRGLNTEETKRITGQWYFWDGGFHRYKLFWHWDIGEKRRWLG